MYKIALYAVYMTWQGPIDFAQAQSWVQSPNLQFIEYKHQHVNLQEETFGSDSNSSHQ